MEVCVFCQLSNDIKYNNRLTVIASPSEEVPYQEDVDLYMYTPGSPHPSLDSDSTYLSVFSLVSTTDIISSSCGGTDRKRDYCAGGTVDL